LNDIFDEAEPNMEVLDENNEETRDQQEICPRRGKRTTSTWRVSARLAEARDKATWRPRSGAISCSWG